MNVLITRAELFAAKAHEGMKRKTGGPYIEHTKRVAAMLAAHGHDDEMVAAGHLHDTVEDTAVTYADLVAEFGERVAKLVMMVTDPIEWPYPKGMTRAKRKVVERAHLAAADPAGATIKLADMIDNFGNMNALAEYDPKYLKFIKMYKAEAKLAHPLLAHGDPVLHKKLGEILARY